MARRATKEQLRELRELHRIVKLYIDVADLGLIDQKAVAAVIKRLSAVLKGDKAVVRVRRVQHHLVLLKPGATRGDTL